MISPKQALDRERANYSGQKIKLRSAMVTEDCTIVVYHVEGERERTLGRSWQIRAAVYVEKDGHILGKTGVIIDSGFTK